ncbi:hypothetical protein D3C84_1014190 [compost metagenome]
MKIDNDSPSRVNGMALTFVNQSGCRFSTTTIRQASRVIIEVRRAICRAMEPLRVVRMPSRLGLGRTIIGVPGAGGIRVTKAKAAQGITSNRQ